MEKKRDILKRGARALVLVLLSAALLTAELSPALAVSQADIDKLKNDAAQLDKDRKKAEEQLKALAGDKTRALERRKVLDERVANTAAQIKNAEAQISSYNDLITQTEAELTEAQAQEEAQYELFCKRVRAMEEQGSVSYWSVLFNAESFTDMLSRLDDVNEVMDADKRVIVELQNLQAEIETKKTDLETSKAASEAAKADLVAKKKTLDVQRAEAIALVKEIQGNEAEYKSTLDEIERDEEAIQARIVKLSKELAAQQAAQGKPSNAALGGYIWPVDSHYITSKFGGRNTGISGASKNHKGIDIGRVGYTSEVHAAKAGTVIVSQYSSSYGNYVVVSHGSGNTTLYAHMSSRKVSVGQYVNQGDVLGITGSTGISSGPHLHFEITENGSRVNPQNYLK